MDKQQHTAEPWSYIGARDSIVGWGKKKRFSACIVRDGVGIIADLNFGHVNADEDARRIVACVNACAGISNQALDEGYIAASIKRSISLEFDRDEAVRQRDKLLEALKALMDDNTGGTWGLPASHKDTVAACAIIAEIESTK